MPTPARAAGSLAAQLRPAAPQILNANHQPAVVQIEAGLDELLLLKRVADLNRGPLGPGRLIEAGRGQHGGSADAITPRCSTQENRHRAGRSGGPQHELILLQDSEAHNVDERIAGVHRVELHLAAQGWDSDCVAVAGDAGHHSVEQIPVVGFGQVPESDLVPQSDRAGTHREDVAQDPSHPGGRPLVRLNEGRVVVALDSQRRQPAVSNVDDAGVFARPDYDPRGVGGKPAQVGA